MASTEVLLGVEKYIQAQIDGKQPVRPVFLVLYGEPGAGKSTTLPIVAEEESISADDIVAVNVDQIVKDQPGYTEARTELLDQHDEKELSDEFIAEDQALYRRYRAQAELISVRLLDVALLGRFHVSVETTGSSEAAIDWMTRNVARARSAGYRCILSYPLVAAAELIKRVKGRIRSQAGNPALLPGQIKAAAANLEKISPLFDTVYLIDNSMAKPKLFFRLEQFNPGTRDPDYWQWRSVDQLRKPAVDEREFIGKLGQTERLECSRCGEAAQCSAKGFSADVCTFVAEHCRKGGCDQ